MSQLPPSPCVPIEFRSSNAIVSIQTGSSLSPSVQNGGVTGGSSNYIIHEYLDADGALHGHTVQPPKPTTAVTTTAATAPPTSPSSAPVAKVVVGAAAAEAVITASAGAASTTPEKPTTTTQEHHHHHHHHHLSHPGSGGSITILTPPSPASSTSPSVSRINICINNHYRLPAMESNQKRRHHAEFSIAEDILVRINDDDVYYLGTITAIGAHSCLVHFDDGTSRWSSFDEIKKLEGGNDGATGSASSSSSKPAITCVVCKMHSLQQTVKVCEGCHRGFHRKCDAQGKQPNGALNEEEVHASWFCRLCTVRVNTPTPSSSELGEDDGFRGFSDELVPTTHKDQLPYDLDALEWDELHRANSSHAYCYCGTDGDWSKEMVQCRWCEQWFHGRCIRSLQYPIFLGDQFYIFLCSICNHGHEFVRRLEMSVCNILHLVLYNLIMRNGHRLFDLNLAILPYIEDNLRALQVPEKFAACSSCTRAELVANTLRSNESIFLCGLELNLPKTLWTLRSRTVPTKTTIDIPRGETITEHLLHRTSVGGTAIKFRVRVLLEKNLVEDIETRQRMLGIGYASTPYSVADPRLREEIAGPSGLKKSDLPRIVSVHGSWSLKRHREEYNDQAPEEASSAHTSSNGHSVNASADSAALAICDTESSSSRRKVATQLKSEVLLSPSLSSCIIDRVIKPPPSYKGEHNPLRASTSGAMPRKARIVKRRLSAKDVMQNRRAKKRRLNQGTAVAVHVPAPASRRPPIRSQAAGCSTNNDAIAGETTVGTISLSRQMPDTSRSATDAVPRRGRPPRTISTDSCDSSRLAISAQEGSRTAPSASEGGHPRRLRPRGSTNYRETKRYKPRSKEHLAANGSSNYHTNSAEDQSTSGHDTARSPSRPSSSFSSHASTHATARASNTLTEQSASDVDQSGTSTPLPSQVSYYSVELTYPGVLTQTQIDEMMLQHFTNNLPGSECVVTYKDGTKEFLTKKD